MIKKSVFRQSLSLLTALVFLFSLNGAHAIGLGKINLHSLLNQPLDAEIPLLHAEGFNADEIKVSIASRHEYNRQSMGRPYFLSQLKFTVVLDDPSKAVIKVTTNEPVHEPFLEILLQVQWPSGQMLREYNLLFDLPDGG